MADYSATQRKQLAAEGEAMKGGRFPVTDRASLEDAIRAVGRAKGGDAGRAAVRRYIIRRAKALGLSKLIPDTWNADGSLKS